MWGIFSTSIWIHLWGWLTGSGASGLDQGWYVDDETLAPCSSGGDGTPLGALFMARLQCINRTCHSWGGSGISIDGLSPDRKKVMTVGKVGSPPSSLARSNWTCFLGISLVRVGPYLAMPYSWTSGSWPVASSLSCGDTATHLNDQTFGG